MRAAVLRVALASTLALCVLATAVRPEQDPGLPDTPDHPGSEDTGLLPFLGLQRVGEEDGQSRSLSQTSAAPGVVDISSIDHGKPQTPTTKVYKEVESYSWI